jgi:hypothetical protein
MVNPASRLFLVIKALRELGPRQLALLARYRLGLHSGYYRWQTPSPILPEKEQVTFHPFLNLPDPKALRLLLGAQGIASCLEEAEEILAGQVRLFGAQAVRLNLRPPGKLTHWTDYERGIEKNFDLPGGDIKFTWEPARFGWIYNLGRAYRVSGDERYAEAFWRYTEEFLNANPPYCGLNWTSAQEAALRLVALSFAAHVFAGSAHTNAGRMALLAQVVAEHAGRIPPTLVYSRAQNNNHLLSEAAGLYTAGVCLPGHPQAGRWRRLGWKWFNQAVQHQIDQDGAYCQHSTNYHRLVLQLALWFNLLSLHQWRALPESSRQRLADATRWLLSLVDPGSGGAPNLGPNDGAYIQPLVGCGFGDYRPVLQAAAAAFLGERPFPAGEWDELSYWLKISPGADRDRPPAAGLADPPCGSPLILRSPEGGTWAYLRAARFDSRPGHADQLHLDLWRGGQNLARDAGTFSYNLAAPWENALSNTLVHNTVSINGLEQMQRSGRFLYLDWAQARVGECLPQRISASHDGYRRLGLEHKRTVSIENNGDWLVVDTVNTTSANKKQPSASFSVRLHWLLPDWPWELSDGCLRLLSPEGWLQIILESQTSDPAISSEIGLLRAGECLFGVDPGQVTWGWYAPTYGFKLPALSFSLTVQSPSPVVLNTRWKFPLESSSV